MGINYERGFECMKLIKRAERKNNIIGEAILMPVPEGVIPVDLWEPSEDEELLVGYQGKNLVVLFDKIFDRNTIKEFNYFDISLKEAYYKQLDVIALYINYFLKFYDSDHELLMAYLKIKYMIDVNHVKNIKRESFIKQLQKILFSDSICEKIKKMSLDNYRVDLTTEIKKKKTSNKTYAPVLQFNEHHAEILMRISVAIKFAIPLVLHYIKVFHNKDEAKYHLYSYFMPLFKNPILIEDVNILGKLHHTISSRVNSYAKPDRAIYGRHEALGSSVETFIEELFHKNLITDTIFSYRFNGNIISYNSVVLRYQLAFHSKEDLKMDFLTVSTEKEPEGLSGFDKMEMYTTKIDVFLILFSQVNIEDTIKRIKARMKIKISDEEIEYYKEKHDFNNLSKELIFYFFAKYFGGFRDLYFIKREQYVTLLVIGKKMLEASGNMYMNQLFSSNMKGKSSARIIRNSKFLEKVMSSSTYQELMEKKYPSLIDEKNNSPVITLLSRLVNSNWSIVDYDMKDMEGEPLEFDNDILAAEFLRFVNNI